MSTRLVFIMKKCYRKKLQFINCVITTSPSQIPSLTPGPLNNLYLGPFLILFAIFLARHYAHLNHMQNQENRWSRFLENGKKP